MNKYNVIFYQIDNTLPVPLRKTKGSIGFDLFVRETTIIEPKKQKCIPLNIVVETTKDLIPLIFPRSSLFKHHSLIVTNSIGLIDWDYIGVKDELKLSVYNLGDYEEKVLKGERIAQLVLVSTNNINVLIKDIKDNNNNIRGGFGSTGI